MNSSFKELSEVKPCQTLLYSVKSVAVENKQLKGPMNFVRCNREGFHMVAAAAVLLEGCSEISAIPSYFSYLTASHQLLSFLEMPSLTPLVHHDPSALICSLPTVPFLNL